MSTSIFHVRPLDSGKGWAIDEYDGRGAWQHSVPKVSPVNKGLTASRARMSDTACEDVADSNDPRLLVKVAHQHWWGIGWPEDEKPIALLERAMTLLEQRP